MHRVLKIALRNLARFHRRTLLTATLITLGMVAVLLFIATAGSFKSMMIGQFTDAVLGHIEVHRKGYVASIDTLPLNLNIQPAMVKKVEQTLSQMPEVEAYSERVKLGAMFSNFNETTSVRVNGIDPAREAATTPLMPGRIVEGSKAEPLLKSGEILIPTLLSRGLGVKLGDSVVLVATNRDGSVNAKTFVVRGIMEAVSGPSGRDAYITLDDSRTLLRMTQPEVSEIAIRLRHPERMNAVQADLAARLAALSGQGTPSAQAQPHAQPGPGKGGGLEVHTWAALSPFSNIANMIDLLTVFIKIMLVSIVLISILNVMVMAVYERVREIGTIAAIGTPPRRILALFLTEGLLLGVGGAVAGIALSAAAIYGLNLWKPTFDFGMQQGLVLNASISLRDAVTIAVLVIVMALLASLQPAWKASRMDPVRALGHV
jgi:putative ABC transport system permease protein